MKIIAITTPKEEDDDVFLIKVLLDKGIDIIHLRKPESNINYCRFLLNNLTHSEHMRIVIHDYPELYDEYSLMGIHLNKNITSLPDDYNGVKTRSCHSIEEIQQYKAECDYLFLSPIFDSISKNGYKSRFSHDDLTKASADGIIDHKVIALGGITFDSIDYLKRLNFGGVAMIGGIYNKKCLNDLNDINRYR